MKLQNRNDNRFKWSKEDNQKATAELAAKRALEREANKRPSVGLNLLLDIASVSKAVASAILESGLKKGTCFKVVEGKKKDGKRDIDVYIP